MSNKRNLIVAHQPETYVYVGDTGYIVVKQQDWQENDMLILIDPQNAAAIADAIKSYVKAAEQAQIEWIQGDDE